MSRADLVRFRDAIERRLGLAFGEDKFDQLDEVLRARLNGSDAGAYLARLEAGIASEEVRALAEFLTVGETFFFRNPDHFRALADLPLPRRPPRILSAGCASGEEPYSVAMTVADADIVAIDVNPAALRKAARGRYGPWSLRETPEEIRRRHFREDELDPAIRSRVRFEERNLLYDDLPGAFDVVFCRNVVMYFPVEVARGVIARIARALVPGGYLFLGHAETLRGLSHDFHLKHTHDTFYYQRRAETSCEPLPVPAAPPVLAPDQSWVDAIQRASERIAALSEMRPEPARSWDPAPAHELLRQERYSEALRSLPPESNSDVDALLLRAALLTNSGAHVDAEQACRQLLERDEMSAGAHYLMALCREHAGDGAGAVHHDRTALYLDPDFAMAHLHLGLMARKAGDFETARRELARALERLQTEDASRILLFGGGFRREALMELCRT